MRKLNSLRKSKKRMTSNAHGHDITEEPAEDGSQRAPNARTVVTDRLKAGSRIVADFASAARRGASAKASSATTETVGRATIVSRKVADTATSLGQATSGKTADVTAVAAERARAGARSAAEATASVAGQLMATTPTLLESNLSEDLNNLDSLVKSHD